MRYPIIVLAAALLATAAQAQILSYTDRFGYTGTVTRYESLADAQNATGPSTVYTLAENRDLRLQLINGFTPVLADQYHFGTHWSVPGSPSNVNTGFVQVPLQYGAPTLRAFWDASLTQYSFTATGSLADPAARLWSGTATGGQAGAFLDYRLSFVASGLEAATWDSSYGTYWTVSDPTAVTGRFSGLYQNTSADAAGFYTFDFELNLESWVYSQFGDSPTQGYYQTSLFAAPTAVPEPSTYGISGALALLALAYWRRARQHRG